MWPGGSACGGQPAPSLGPRAVEPEEGLAYEAGPHQGVAEALVRPTGLSCHVFQGKRIMSSILR